MGSASGGSARLEGGDLVADSSLIAAHLAGDEQSGSAQPEAWAPQARELSEGQAGPEEIGSGRDVVRDGAALQHVCGTSLRRAFRFAGWDPPRLTFPMNNLGVCGCLAEGVGGEDV